MPLHVLPSVISTPGWRRSLWLRRLLALCLVLAAGAAWVLQRPAPGEETVVFRSGLAAGARITPADVEVVTLPSAAVPPTRLTGIDEAVGEVTVAAVAPGQVITRSLVISGAVADLTTAGEPVDLVPLKLASPEVIPLLRHGDTVAVVSRDDASPEPVVLADGARVVLAGEMPEDSPAPAAHPTAPGTVLVALPGPAARVVAAAALVQPIALIITGERTGGNHQHQ